MASARTASRPRLYYQDTGSGTPLLLITGWSISSAVFEPMGDLFADRFRILSFDARSTGRSERRPGLVSMADLAADAVRVLDNASVVSAHVFGISMGGMVAQELAIRFPHRVRGLMLAGTWTGGPLATRPAPSAALATGRDVAVGSIKRRGLWLGPLLFSEDFLARDPAHAARLVALFRLHRAPLWSTAAQLLGASYADTAGRLDAIGAPTLVMHGELDAMVPPRNAELLAAGIADAELRTFGGCGHAFPLEAPDRTREAMLGWLDPREPIRPSAAYDAARARRERIGRPFELPAGTLRTGRSLARRLVSRR